MTPAAVNGRRGHRRSGVTQPGGSAAQGDRTPSGAWNDGRVT
ncbi:hypothetical protein KCH_30550 [Kitasatospora cheerisanensis KCTC 2395]|uniref:Uncharacterized protein n=1 Tax=Kitasatospora cheerisanensis KCTC 2395 TaxID=1348663 RepID=A0A066Z4I5_9ACTN|nr:hypothetical protein KCH_30550 [Kitasatospora cheerisanensis KCTC 2395]